MQPTLIQNIKMLRSELDERTKILRGMMAHQDFNSLPEKADAGEMKANIMLALRHTEDARMRLGKVIQAHDGGESIYDKAPTQ